MSKIENVYKASVLHPLPMQPLRTTAAYIDGKISTISQKTDGMGEEINELRKKIEKLKKENDLMKEKIKEMESRKETGEVPEQESSINQLQKELVKIKTEIDQLCTEIEKNPPNSSTQNSVLVEQVEALTKELEDVKNKFEELQDTLVEMIQSFDLLNKEMEDRKAENKEIREKLERKDTKLALCQTAWLLEAEIWKAVLPDQKMGYTRVLNSMNRWLDKNSSTPEGEAAKKRWDDLKEKLNWNEDDHNYALTYLKDLRMEGAHPENVDLEVARKELDAYVAEVDRKACEDIINMVDTVKKLNNS